MHETGTLAGIMVPMIQLLLWPARVQAERPSAKRMRPSATSSPVEVVPAHFAERNVSGPVEYGLHQWAWQQSTFYIRR